VSPCLEARWTELQREQERDKAERAFAEREIREMSQRATAVGTRRYCHASHVRIPPATSSTRIMTPRLLSCTASSDVASDICCHPRAHTARHVIDTHYTTPRLLSYAATYDVASDICCAALGYGDAGGGDGADAGGAGGAGRGLHSSTSQLNLSRF